MGTVVSFDVRPRPDASASAVEALIDEACTGLHRADEVFSLWKPDSVASRLRRGELAEAACPPDMAEVIDRCRRARQATDGWFDPWAAPGGFDPTGLVKGWALQRAAAVLRGGPVAGAMVNGGGDIACLGEPEPGAPWLVGIQHTSAPGKVVRVLAVRDAAVATSGTYERGEHIYDPHSGVPVVASLLSATVVGADLALADAMATALFAAGDAGVDFVLRGGDSAFVVPRDVSRREAGSLPVVGGGARGQGA